MVTQEPANRAQQFGPAVRSEKPRNDIRPLAGDGEGYGERAGRDQSAGGKRHAAVTGMGKQFTERGDRVAGVVADESRCHFLAIDTDDHRACDLTDPGGIDGIAEDEGLKRRIVGGETRPTNCAPIDEAGQHRLERHMCGRHRRHRRAVRFDVLSQNEGDLEFDGRRRLVRQSHRLTGTMEPRSKDAAGDGAVEAGFPLPLRAADPPSFQPATGSPNRASSRSCTS